jgi:hypothetical protein
MKFSTAAFFALFVFVSASMPVQASSILSSKKDVIGTILEVEGRATVNKHKASVKTPVHRGDVIATGLKSRVYILLMDNTELTLAENGQLKLDDYVFNPNDSSDNRAVYSVIKGAFMYVSGLVAKRPNPDVKINIPQGSIGIRGTKFWTGEKNGSYGVVVGDGEVEVKTKRGKVRLKKGQGTALRKTLEGAVPTPVTEWNKQEIQAAVQTVTFSQPQAIAVRMEEEKTLIQPLLREQHMEVQREIIAEIKQELLEENPELAQSITKDHLNDIRDEMVESPNSSINQIVKKLEIAPEPPVDEKTQTQDELLQDDQTQPVKQDDTTTPEPQAVQEEQGQISQDQTPVVEENKTKSEIRQEERQKKREERRAEKQEDRIEKREQRRADKAEEKAELRAQRQEEQIEKREQRRADKAEEKAELRAQRQEAQNEKREEKRQQNKKDDGGAEGE